jgi:hypothetical protein
MPFEANKVTIERVEVTILHNQTLTESLILAQDERWRRA